MKKSIFVSVLVFSAALVLVGCKSNPNEPEGGGSANGHKYVDLGLSVKWATMNVGATTPEGYGDYYAWGETSTKSTYDWGNYFDTNDGYNKFTKYNNEGGKTVLDPEDDAAHVNWGDSWRMPTLAECRELIDNCTWTLTTQNGINGYKVTSNKAGYTDRFIFLPAAGNRYDSGLYDVGFNGLYWSSSLYEYGSDGAWHLSIGLDGRFLDDYRYYYSDRFLGLSVRPVLP